MVAFNHTFGPAKYLIPADIKRTTIRTINEQKMEQIERIGYLEHYWKQGTEECELLGERELKKLTVIEEPIVEFIRNAPPELVYGEGFGFDRVEMELFFVNYYKEKVAESRQFYITEWWPAERTTDIKSGGVSWGDSIEEQILSYLDRAGAASLLELKGVFSMSELEDVLDKMFEKGEVTLYGGLLYQSVRGNG